MSNLVTITDMREGTIQVSFEIGIAPRELFSRRVAFADPLSSGDRQELRWYLEEYLSFPYGAERDRALRVEQQMKTWGESLFGLVFTESGSDPSPRALYEESIQTGRGQCEISIASNDSIFLDIPWELLRDPTPGRGYLAPNVKGLYRQLSSPTSLITKPGEAAEPFRVLLVIARKKDDPISVRSDGRMLLHALKPLGAKVCLEVLRPPTFDAFQRRLNLQPGFFDLVHFDGHGEFVHDGEGESDLWSTEASTGRLLFETVDGESHLVSSDEIGQVLVNSGVRFFVISACESAEEGRSAPFSSVASRLIAAGASGVIGMSYSVLSETAEKFAQGLYESLVNHSSLSEAVASARRRLFSDSLRESLLGPLRLRDWIIPRLYLQTAGIVPIPESGRCNCPNTDAATGNAFADQNRLLPEGQYGFIGRDQEILQIERALRNDDAPWIMIAGMGGVGKTELAYGFGRWYRETGGCPQGIYVTSFKARTDFDHIAGSIAGFGTDFSALAENVQFEKISSFLHDNSCLLIWDNFETVIGYPTEAHSLATDEDREKISALLQSLRGGKTKVIITTRKAEHNWTGIAPTLIELAGLTFGAAAMLAKEILRTVGRQPQEFQDDPNYGMLIRLLTGHPRSLQIVIPLLKNRQPKQVIDSLQQQMDSVGKSVSDASMEYAFSQMSETMRQRLPIVGLFSSFVILNCLEKLTQFSEQGTAVYTSIMGDDSRAPSWECLLEEAADAGFIRSLGPRLYEIHPTLPVFLRQRLTDSIGLENVNRLNSCFLRVYGAMASDLSFQLQRRNPAAIVAAQLEEHNLLRALSLAERAADWENAQYLTQALFFLYKDGGFYADSVGLIRRLLQEIGREPSIEATPDKIRFWKFLMSVELEQALDAGHFSRARTGHKKMIEYLLSLNDPTHDKTIAMGYGNLGIIAQEEHQYELAEDFLKKALEIFVRLGFEGEPEAANIYHSLATLATSTGRLRDAESLCVRAGSIFQKNHLYREASDSAVQLAVIKIKQGYFAQAEALCSQTVGYFEKMGLKREAAQAYHNLGVSLQDMGQLDAADRALREAAVRFESLGLPKETATVFHHLGMNAQERKDFDMADCWYKRALEKLLPFRYDPLLVPMMTQLGVLYHDQAHFREGLQWLAEAYRIVSQHRMEGRRIVLFNLCRYMLSMGRSNLIATWDEVSAGSDLPVDEISAMTITVENTMN